MAYDETLAESVRGHLAQRDDVTERKMFGGLCFMTSGNMVCGVVGDDLMVRVGPDQYDSALAKPGARPMDFTGRPMKGMLYVDRAGIEAGLESWLEQALSFAAALPAKTAPARSKRKKGQSRQ